MEGSVSPPERSSTGRLRTTLSRAAEMLARPSPAAASRTSRDGRTKIWNRWATPGTGSRFSGPWATTGMTTLPARRTAAASSPSSGRSASKKISNAITRGPWPLSTSRAWA
jgi:hypothetical protein